MTDAEKATIAGVLNKLPFVAWDRFVDVPPSNDIGDGNIDVYGWITRPDGRFDFVLLTFPRPIAADYVGYTTSSARHSAEIGELIHLAPGDIECQRVDEAFGHLVDRWVVRA